MGSSIELIFIPALGAGHLVSATELAKLLIARDSRLSITVLLLKLPFDSDTNTTAESLSSSSAASERIKFVDLPRDEASPEFTHMSIFTTFYQSQKRHVSDAVAKISSSGSARLGGFVLDMFCTSMIDVADDFGVPSYVFLTCSAGFLCLTYHLLGDERTVFDDDLDVPGFANPVPETAFPSVFLSKAYASIFQNMGRGIAKSKGVLLNTFVELEPGIIKALSSMDRAAFPPVYPVGPVINISPGSSHVRLGGTDRKEEIMEWLDRQPSSSVVFLCFGSMGSFNGDQVREIAIALERTGVRFLWSLRQPGQKDKNPTPTEYDNPSEVLPEGFLEQTVGIGKVVGWAPQVAVLGHPAVGGFVSHCGWNSTLESIWFGVPIATWPLYAEQQLNAFELVKEYGLAVEIKMDYRKEFFTDERFQDTSSIDMVVRADQIEKGILKLMESESDLKKRVKEMSEKSRKVLLPGGFSYTSLSIFIDDVIKSMA